MSLGEFISGVSAAVHKALAEQKKAQKAINDGPLPSKARYQPIGEIYDPKRRMDSIIIDHNISFTEESSVDWTAIRPRGALGSIYTYNMTPERTIPLHFTITDYSGNSGVIQKTKELLHKWKKPKISKGKIVSPPPVLEFYYKGFIEPNRAIRCILQSFSIQGNEDDGWNIANETPYTIDVSVTLAEIGVIPRNF